MLSRTARRAGCARLRVGSGCPSTLKFKFKIVAAQHCMPFSVTVTSKTNLNCQPAEFKLVRRSVHFLLDYHQDWVPVANLQRLPASLRSRWQAPTASAQFLFGTGTAGGSSPVPLRALRVSLLLSESSVNIGHSLRDSSWRGRTGIGTTVKSGLQIQLCILFSSRTTLAVQVCCFSVPQAAGLLGISDLFICCCWQHAYLGSYMQIQAYCSDARPGPT